MNGCAKGFNFDLSNDEKVDSVVVYSRSDNGCELSVVNGKNKCLVDNRNVSREHATRKAINRADAPNKGTSHNNYAVEVATSKDFPDDATGSFSVKTKGGNRGDNFLIAISIGKK